MNYFSQFFSNHLFLMGNYVLCLSITSDIYREREGERYRRESERDIWEVTDKHNYLSENGDWYIYIYIYIYIKGLNFDILSEYFSIFS